MLTNKIRTRHWVLFILLAVGLILCLIGLAISRGEQQVEAENFRLVFYLSMLGTIIFGFLLIVGILYLGRWIDRKAVIEDEELIKTVTT